MLGGKAFAPNGVGFGTERPAAISNGGASASGSISSVRWNSWGQDTAIGWGKIPLFKPRGGYYKHRVWIKLRAWVVGKCERQRAYTRLSIRYPRHPGGPLGPWRLWSGAASICSWPS